MYSRFNSRSTETRSYLQQKNKATINTLNSFVNTIFSTIHNQIKQIFSFTLSQRIASQLFLLSLPKVPSTPENTNIVSRATTNFGAHYRLIRP